MFDGYYINKMITNEKKLKHLEMIQNVINRLSNNSFSLKLKAFVFVAVVFGLTIKDIHINYVWLTLLPTLAFWGLDGFYLKQEKLYRSLYDKVRQTSENDIDFSMDVSSVKCSEKRWISVCISWTILGFHLPIFIFIVSIVFSLYLKKQG